MILGVDPGSTESAYVLWDGATIHNKGMFKNKDFVLLQLSRAKAVAVEHLQCMGMPIGVTTLETAYWIGDFRCTARLSGALFLPVYRSEVKMHFCHSMRAKDGNIRQALIDRLGAPGVKKAQGVTYGVSGDIWSALAIAVMTFDKTQVTGA